MKYVNAYLVPRGGTRVPVASVPLPQDGVTTKSTQNALIAEISAMLCTTLFHLTRGDWPQIHEMSDRGGPDLEIRLQDKFADASDATYQSGSALL